MNRSNFLLIILFFLLSCENEKTIIQLEDTKYSNKDIERLLDIKIADVADREKLEDAVGNKLFRGLKVATYFSDLQVDGVPESELKQAFNYKYAHDHYLKKVLFPKITGDDYMEMYYNRSSQNLIIKHLHLHRDTLNAGGYDFNNDEFNNLVRTISEDLHNNPEKIDSYIVKYGYKSDVNRGLVINWTYFPYKLSDKIYTTFEEGDKSLGGFIKTSFGYHYVIIMNSQKNDKFTHNSFEEFKKTSTDDNFKNMRQEFVRYRQYHYDNLLDNAEVINFNQNIVESILSMNGLEEKDILDRRYKNLTLATFYLDNKTTQIEVKTSDIHNYNFENMFKKIDGIRLKPNLMSVYVENYVSAVLSYEQLESLGKLDLINQKAIDYEVSMLKFDEFTKDIKNSVQITDAQIEAEYQNNISEYVTPIRRKTYGFSVGYSDSAKLVADYPKMTARNLKQYYFKYNPYIKARKNVKMRFLGDLQPKSYGKVSEEVFKLKKPYQLSEILFHDNRFFVFYYSEELPEEQNPLSQVAHTIKTRLSENRYKAITDSVDNLIEQRFENSAFFYAQNL